MAGPQEENGTVNATETDPLLGNRDPEASVGSPDATTQNDEEENGIPIADEPSTKYLLVIAATTWLGSFFAALGKLCSSIQGSIYRPDYTCYG